MDGNNTALSQLIGVSNNDKIVCNDIFIIINEFEMKLNLKIGVKNETML